MAITPTMSVTMTIRDLANLSGVSETLISVAGGGRVTASTNYTSILANTDNFKYVCFGGTLTDGTRVPGIFTHMPSAALQVATGAAVAATDTITITMLANYRYDYNFMNFFEALSRVQKLLLFAPAGATSPGQQVTWTV
jgi:hypothetical protein